MPIADLAILAALQGLTEALPVSRSGHGAVARLWLGGEGDALALSAFLQAGVLLALGWVIRHRLRAAIAEGVRAVSRPTLFRSSPAAHDGAAMVLAVAGSVATSLAAGPLAAPWTDAPSAVGLGLLMTGLALASTALVPPGRLESPRLRAALLIGIGHGLAVSPGASSVGIALTLALWLGVRPVRAAEFAFAITLPSLAISFGSALAHRPALDAGAAAAGILLAFLGARLGAALLRGLLDRHRLALLSLWLMPLSLATLAYARALPS